MAGSGYGPGLAEVNSRPRGDEEVQGEVDKTDHQSAEEGAAKGGDREAGYELAGEEEQDGIDEDQAEAECEDDKGKGKEDEDRLQDDVEEGEHEGHEDKGSAGRSLDVADEPGCAENPQKEDHGVAEKDG